MGVEYMHYLIPDDNTDQPRPEELSRLIGSLLGGGFVNQAGTDAFRKTTFSFYSYYEHAEPTGCFAHVGGREYRPFPCPCTERDIAGLGEGDYRLVWPVESANDSGLKYPLTPFPEWGDAYYQLELHVARDFVYHTSELIEPFEYVVCECGLPLAYDDPTARKTPHPVFYEGRIHRTCPACGMPFRPQELVARVRDGWTNRAGERPGGATYRFAVVIDCGKGFAREAWPIRATEEFMGTVTRALGRRFYEVADMY